MNSVYSVTFGPNTLVFQITSTSTPEVFSRLQVSDVQPVNQPNYVPSVPNPTVASTSYGVSVIITNGPMAITAARSLIIPMNVANQATWVNTPTGQAQAITDIRNWVDGP